MQISRQAKRTWCTIDGDCSSYLWKFHFEIMYWNLKKYDYRWTGREFLNSVIWSVTNENITHVINSNAFWLIQQACTTSSDQITSNKNSTSCISIIFDDSIVISIGNEQCVITINENVDWIIERCQIGTDSSVLMASYRYSSLIPCSTCWNG